MIIRALLGTLRSLILLKRYAGPVAKKIFAPLFLVGRFLMRSVGIPAFRLLFFIRRHSARVLLPAKNRVLYFVSNRYAIHATIILVAALVGTVNVGGSEVRAETFGQKSILYSLVSQDDSEIVEVVAAQGTAPKRLAVSYMNDPVIDINAHIDLNFIDEDYVTTVVGGDAVSSPTISADRPIPVRSETVAYEVAEGDALGTIAEQHGLSLSTILWANDLNFRSTIQPGQTLKIPPIDGVVHTVKRGDTILKLANYYDADTDKIISFNKLASSHDIKIGERLMIPGGEKPRPVVRRTAPVRQLFAPPTNKPVTSSGRWVWPTDWHVITQYYGWRHTGLDVDGNYSTNSYAANDGVVVYSGWRRGYGLTVELDHGGGIHTRYAHHSRNYVGVGERVAAGQAIAQTGTTGRSTGTHLHFEVIRNGRFQNPLDYVR